MLKLPQLPDRIPVKLTITLQPDMKKALDDYAACIPEPMEPTSQWQN